MIKFIKKYINAIKYSTQWVRALDLAATKQNQEAKEVLMQIEHLMKTPLIEYCLLRGYLELCLSHKNESLRYLDIALNRLNTKNSYSQADAYYMKVYANQLKINLLWGQQCFITIDYEKLELDKVSKHLIENFPLAGSN